MTKLDPAIREPVHTTGDVADRVDIGLERQGRTGLAIGAQRDVVEVVAVLIQVARPFRAVRSAAPLPGRSSRCTRSHAIFLQPTRPVFTGGCRLDPRTGSRTSGSAGWNPSRLVRGSGALDRRPGSREEERIVQVRPALGLRDEKPTSQSKLARFLAQRRGGRDRSSVLRIFAAEVPSRSARTRRSRRRRRSGPASRSRRARGTKSLILRGFPGERTRSCVATHGRKQGRTRRSRGCSLARRARRPAARVVEPRADEHRDGMVKRTRRRTRNGGRVRGTRGRGRGRPCRVPVQSVVARLVDVR